MLFKIGPEEFVGLFEVSVASVALTASLFAVIVMRPGLVILDTDDVILAGDVEKILV